MKFLAACVLSGASAFLLVLSLVGVLTVCCFVNVAIEACVSSHAGMPIPPPPGPKPPPGARTMNGGRAERPPPATRPRLVESGPPPRPALPKAPPPLPARPPPVEDSVGTRSRKRYVEERSRLLREAWQLQAELEAVRPRR